MLAVEPVYQKDDWTCGRAALAMLFKFYKTPVPRDLEYFCSPDEGIQPDAVKAILHRQYGHYTSCRMTVGILRGYIRDGKPVLTPIVWDEKNPQESHWVVVRGVTPRRVHYVCPLEGFRSRSIDEWMKFWYGWGGLVGYFCWGVTSWPIDS